MAKAKTTLVVGGHFGEYVADLASDMSVVLVSSIIHGEPKLSDLSQQPQGRSKQPVQLAK